MPSIPQIKIGNTTYDVKDAAARSLIRRKVLMESGTFLDSDGKTKTANVARKRNAQPVPVADFSGIIIPDGYEMYVFFLDASLNKIGTTSSWVNTYFNVFNCTSGTEYINVCVRNIEAPSSDISSLLLEPSLAKKTADFVLPAWNATPNGIYISGNSIVVNQNGFRIIFGGKHYYIAPIDGETITTFVPPDTDPLGTYALVINLQALTIVDGRNDPSAVMSVRHISDQDLNSELYSVVAFFYKGSWGYVGAYMYFNQMELASIDPDYVTWNVAIGGIRINAGSVVVNENGFTIAYKGHLYFIAPTDGTTVTKFEAPDSGGTYLLVLDPDKLTNSGVRTNPSDIMSVIGYYTYDYSKNYIVVANYYKGSWSFAGKFDYFNSFSGSGSGGGNGGVVSPCLQELHMIAHKGGGSAEENTIANFTAAIQHGFKIVEADVQFTSDSVPVLRHDDYISYQGDQYNIASYTYDQLVAMKPNLAKFEDLILLCKKYNIAIDVDFTKTYTTSQTEILYNLIAKHGAFNRCMITCYAGTARQLLSLNSKSVICVSNLAAPSEVDNVGDIISGAAMCFVSVNYENATEELFTYIHKKNAYVKLWTVNEASSINGYLEMGVDLIISDTLQDSIFQNE